MYLQTQSQSTYLRRSTTTVGSETNEIETLKAPIIPVGQVGPVKTGLLWLQALVVSVFRAWVALVSTPPLDS
jgi:hypothetical protein